MLLDFGHSLYGLETPADAAQLCIDHGRLFAIDVNDNFRGWDDDMVVGSVHLVETFEFFHTLRRNNWQGVWQLDQFPFREDCVDAAKQAIRFLKAVHGALDSLDEEALAAAQASHDALAAQRLVQKALLTLDGGMGRLMTALSAEHTTMPVFGRLAPTATRAELIDHIAEAARQIRIQDAKLVHYAGAGHIGGDFSAIDILADPVRRGAQRHAGDRRGSRTGPVHPQQGSRRGRALHHAGRVRVPPGRASWRPS